ncbi:enoyl-CoA hydratase-related protein [Pelagibius sp. Alg239-R121]|uniref:enoyl-CoA hydratase-related protein n=1 Tax=Pelagibius sp. Alg239-R121 TaxID=2993448 RepID=UPI0024A787C2|nr:enoyl-CoA hydratase-related protein [Pelagibius sp. Alg239-R121]
MAVGFEIRDQVAWVTIDRPERMNAVDRETEERLEEIWHEIEGNPDLRCAVLTGAGDRAFSAGADMKAADAVNGLEYWGQARPHGFGGISLRDGLDIPVIARVNGLAMGGGFEMVLGCDIVIAAETAKFALPEPRVGRLPLDGGMVLLPRLIPHKIAMGYLLTGRRMSATDAESFGLVNEVVTLENLDEAVDRWVADIKACAPLSLKAVKHTVGKTAQLNARDAQALRTPALVAALQSNDSEEGVLAFREKRAPVWTGT